MLIKWLLRNQISPWVKRGQSIAPEKDEDNFSGIAIICDYFGRFFRDGRTRKSEPLETFFS